nr:MAG TPA: hypothetical protein [Caudoviricetes sp.]
MLYHPLYHLVRRVDNDSVICVTGGERGTRVICQFFCQFCQRTGNGRNRYCTCVPNFASFRAICQF